MVSKRPELTRLEGEVMGAIWEFAPEAVCVRDVLEHLNARRHKKLAYNTVQTVFTLLKEKSAIKRAKSQGRAHMFKPTYTREAASKNSMLDLAKRMFGGEVKPMLFEMIEQADLSPDDLQELRSWVDTQLEDLGPNSVSSKAGKKTTKSSSGKGNKHE